LHPLLGTCDLTRIYVLPYNFVWTALSFTKRTMLKTTQYGWNYKSDARIRLIRDVIIKSHMYSLQLSFVVTVQANVWSQTAVIKLCMCHINVHELLARESVTHKDAPTHHDVGNIYNRTPNCRQPLDCVPDLRAFTAWSKVAFTPTNIPTGIITIAQLAQ
jgi:hypothetical protein